MPKPFSDVVSNWMGPEKYNNLLAQNPLNRNLGQAAGGDISQIFQSLAALGDPRMTAILNQLTKDVTQATGVAAHGASLRGARLGQDISASVGAIGAGGTGVGAVSRGIGRSMASTQASQAMQTGANLLAEQRAQIQQQYLGSLLGIAGPGGIGTATSKYQGDLQYKIAKMQEPSWWEQFTGAFGGALGALPWGQWFPGNTNKVVE